MKKYFLSILCVLTFLSCKRDIVYTFEQASFSSKDFKLCKYDSCPKLTLSYVVFKTPEALAITVNNDIENYLRDRLVFENQAASSIKDVVEIYLSNAQNAYPETSEFSEAHKLEMDIDVTYSANNVLSLQAYYYEFAGGAHGTSGVNFWNYNPKTGKKIEKEMLFKDVEAFSAFAKAKFIQTHGPLHLFLFENNAYTLPENIGFNQEGMKLFYNTYEIATYAAGAFELDFSWEEIEKYLSF